MNQHQNSKITFDTADTEDRQKIFSLRHTIYAQELRQHPTNSSHQLQDDLDDSNYYIVAKCSNEIIGFISITSPAAKKFSVDKYFDRSLIPFPFDGRLYEIRLLSVDEKHRQSFLAFMLMYAAYRWIQSNGGKYIVAICRHELLNMYCKAGLTPLSVSVKSGEVTYQLATATIEDIDKVAVEKGDLIDMLKAKINWKLHCSYTRPSACYHGGAFFKAIGEELSTIEKRHEIINADVLDAWFPPSPKVVAALQNELSWLLQTSPPTHCDGLIDTIAAVRKVNKECILPGAGSSNLIFLALQYFLNSSSKVMIIDPCYGEYIHVLENIVHCNVTRFALHREQSFKMDIDALINEAQRGYNMIILVNPNSPTGVYVPKEEMRKFLLQVPPNTLVWIDETYIEYAGETESLEQFATETYNVIICKSMSKVYSLSGARSAYLCCSSSLIETLKSLTPPWSVSLPAQLAAITALKDDDYYKRVYAETHTLHNHLKNDLQSIGTDDIIEGVANFLLFYLPSQVQCTKKFIDKCKSQNLYVRDVSNMGENIGKGAIRIAVKDELANKRMIEIIKHVMQQSV